MTAITRLDSLQQFLLNEFIAKDREFRKEYTRNKKCSCAKNLKARRVLNCVHVNEAINKKFEKEIKVVRGMCNLTTLKALIPYPQIFNNFLESIKKSSHSKQEVQE